MGEAISEPRVWETACPDWADRIQAGRSLVPPLPLFDEEASRAVRIFNRLRLPDVPGMPTLGEATGDWFRDIVAALFGSYDPETNIRHIQEIFLLVPKKNGKSTNAAAIMVTALIVNRRPLAEFLMIAPTKEIADISFSQAEGMIKADAELTKLFHVQRHIRKIAHRASGAFMQIKAADTDAITGVKATGILVDETHVFAAKASASAVFVEVRGALAARPDGFMIQITTQSKTPPAGVFKAELTRAREVRDGKRVLPLLPVLYELPPGLIDAWDAPENMALVNPNMGRSLSVDFLVRELADKRIEGPEALALFASQHANKEIGLALMSDRWAGADYWQGAGDKAVTLDEILSRSDVVEIGIDGGGLDDLLALSVIGRDAETREWLHWARAWAHTSVLERRKSEAPRLMGFRDDGDLFIVDTLPEDLDGVVAVVEQVEATGKLDKVGVDALGAGGIVDSLAEIGITQEAGRIVGIPQGYKLAGAIWTVERKLADGTFKHGGQPLMAWAVGNARVEPRGNAVLITKQAAGRAKIDPLIATLNAAALMSLNPAAPGAKYITVPADYEVAVA